MSAGQESDRPEERVSGLDHLAKQVPALFAKPADNNLATSTMVRSVAAERTDDVLLDENACHGKDNLEG